MNGELHGVEPLADDDPRRIGPIPLVGRLGSGGMGRVYLGVHEGRYAAVKQVLPSVVGEDKDFVRRFGHELDNLARLPARATAPLLAGDRDARPPWFATAYVPGLTLSEAVVAHGGPLPAASLWLLLREAAAGLAAVHELDMVHRDVKPSNVMLTLDGVTLIDFGVARAAEQSQLTRTGMMVGTPAYMSPEQASGARRLTGAVDVFALGSVVAFAGSGRPPFGDESGHAVLYRIVHERPDLAELRAADPELASVVASCLDKDPEGRPTAAELLELTETRVPPADGPRWPPPLTEHLARRAALAAEVLRPEPGEAAGEGAGEKPGDLGEEAAEAAEERTGATAAGEAAAAEGTAGKAAAAEGTAGEAAAGGGAAEGSADGGGADGGGADGGGADGGGADGGGADGGGGGESGLVVRPAGEPRKRHPHRTRVLLAVVPVAVGAGVATLAFQLAPYVTDARRDGAAGRPDTSVSAPVHRTPGASATGAATSPEPGGKGSASPADAKKPGKDSASAGGKGEDGKGGGAGGATDGGSGGGSGSGAASGSGGSASGSGGSGGSGAGGGAGGTGTSAGSGGSGDSGGSAGNAAGGTSTTPDSFRLKNGENGKCLIQVYGSTGLGDCSGETARWTFRSASGGSVKVVNVSTGACLSANGNGQAVFTGDCAQSGSVRLWRTGSGNSLSTVYDGGCLDLAFGGGVAEATCQSGAASQNWARI